MRRLLTAGARWRTALFSLGAAVAFALSVAAPAHAQAHADDRYLVATRDDHGSSGSLSSSEPEIVRVARRHVGATARELALPSTLWCADFACVRGEDSVLRAIGSTVTIGVVGNFVLGLLIARHDVSTSRDD